MRITSLIIDH